ncbi:hypothetical protein VII00023_16405 [Vibrio ichthyoenteri ATCC 700023]|uniref:Uncharacterized protein n=1 Tax=Vibrio ichthyoenteri ATCC 700023 TaxID=870968 RepID=F9S0G1_9VIBR|nr:hypothetical protein [Vibrio ichthyoenteri]EGU43431.1 hypothetical protein VII00023_16405 [Vibrio ichthyoenteri ATCC 700023]
MKKLKIVSMAAALSMVSMAHAQEMTQEQLDSLFQDTSLSPIALIEQFSLYSVEDNLVLFLQEVAKQRLDVFAQVLTLAFIQYPDYIDLIVATARELGLSNEEITIAAIEAGIDPTIIAEATAAGTETVVETPIPNAPTKKDPISAN